VLAEETKATCADIRDIVMSDGSRISSFLIFGIAIMCEIAVCSEREQAAVVVVGRSKLGLRSMSQPVCYGWLAESDES